MELDEMRVLVAVAECGTLLGAARSLTTSRARLRRMLANLETRVGASLLSRVEGELRPTAAGQAVISGARRIFEDVGTLLDNAREVALEPTGVLRVAVPVGAPPHTLALVGRMLRERYPKLRMDIRVCEAQLEHVPGNADIAFCLGAPPAPPSRHKAIVVWRLRMLLMADRTYLRAHGEPATLEDLSGHDVLAWRHPQAATGHLQLRDGNTWTITPTLVCSDDQLLRTSASQGVGIIYVPVPAVPDPLWPDLVPVLEDVVGSAIELTCYVPKALEDVPRVKVVIELARQGLELARAHWPDEQ